MNILSNKKKWNRGKLFHFIVTIFLFFLLISKSFSQNDSITIDPIYLINETNRLLIECSKPLPLPIFLVYGKAGMNLAKKIYTGATSSYSSLTDFSSKNGFGYQSGIGLEYCINKRIAVNAEISFLHKTLLSHCRQNNNLVEYDLVQSQNWFELPIVIKYTIDKYKIKPYFQTGISYETLLKNNPKFTTTIKDDYEPIVYEAAISEDIYNAEVNLSFIFGGGLKFRHYQDFFFIDFRYSIGINIYENLSHSSTSYYLWSQYFVNEKDYLLRNLYLSFGFSKTIIKSK